MKYQSSRHAFEVLDDARSQMRTIINTAERAGRDLTVAETAAFDSLEVQAREAQQQHHHLQQTEQKIKQLAIQARNQEMSTNANRVLPTNGLLPGESAVQSWNPSVNYKCSKLRAFKGPDAERNAYAAGMFLRAFVARHWDKPDPVANEYCNRLGWDVRNAASEGSGPSGGYLVPAPLSNSIIEVMETVSVIKQVMATTPMTSDTLSVPKRAGGLTVYYPGEGGLITDSDKQWAQVGLIAKKRAVASLISSELVDDALINVVDNVVMEMGHALGLKMDSECIKGDGTSTYGGVSGLLTRLGTGGVYTADSGDDTWAELSLADFTATMGKLPDRYHSLGPSFLCSSAFYFQVMLRVLAEAGGNTISSMQGGDGGTRQFLGYPVFLTENLPTSTAASTVACLFGAFNAGAVLGERLGVRFARSDDYKFLEDLTALRATARYDFTVHDGGDDNAAGAYVGLKTNS